MRIHYVFPNARESACGTPARAIIPAGTTTLAERVTCLACRKALAIDFDAHGTGPRELWLGEQSK
jgi:hypothetical protein